MDKAQVAPGKFTFRDLHPISEDSRSEILSGLRANPKSLDPKWLYDERGSQLFQRITQLPEYYPSRTETRILRDNAASISRFCGAHCVLVEPGSGNCEKVRLLLNEMRPRVYVPIDISADFLCDAAYALSEEFSWLRVEAVCADFNKDWSFFDELPEGKRVVFYPGSTIGNLEPGAAVDFLRQVGTVVGESGGALIGVDLHKSSRQLNAAYNDSQGVTAAFNLNVLNRINRMFNANFDLSTFRHHAFYNSRKRRVEMHLVSEREQTVSFSSGSLHFARGESIHTESSYKYTVDDFSALASAAGLSLESSWIDPDQQFSVHYLTAT